MATPNYTIVSPPAGSAILEGAMKAFAGISAEAASAKKASEAYGTFADQLDASGLHGDAAMYRGMASAQRPNFIEAALTGRAAERNLQAPFAQALNLLNEERDRNNALRKEIIAEGNGGGLSVTDRQNVRMDDAILSRDVDITMQEVRDAKRDMDDAKEAAIRDQGNPELVKHHMSTFNDAQKRYQMAVDKANKYQQERRANASRLRAGQQSAPLPQSGSPNGSPNAGDLPVPPFTPDDGTSTVELLPNIGERGSLMPFNEEGPSALPEMSSRALRRAKEQAAIRFLYDSGVSNAIDKAASLSELNKITDAAEKERGTFDSAQSAIEAGQKVAPTGFTAVPKPRAGRFTYDIVRSPSESALKNTEIVRGDKVYYQGTDGFAYGYSVDKDRSSATIVKQDGAAVTFTKLKAMMDDLETARKMNLYNGPSAELRNQTSKETKQLPQLLNTNPNTPQTTPLQRTMRDWQNTKSRPQ